MIFITGDTHGNIDNDKLRKFVLQHPNLSKKDYVLIAGDFGGVWSEQTLQQDLAFYKALPCTVLFVDGNHENHDLLNRFPVTRWKRGKVHRISSNIIHLMRGQVFELPGESGSIAIATLGGGDSRDKEFRREGKSWWAAERITDADVEEFIRSVKAYPGRIDYCVTHAPSIDVTIQLYNRSFKHSPYGNPRYYPENCPSDYLVREAILASGIKPRCIFSGHQHLDEEFKLYGQRHRLLFNDFVKIG